MADLPLVCPPQSELELLLNKSLSLEQRLLPQLHQAQEHADEFWKLAHEDRIFCWVDRKRLLDGQTTWEGVLKMLRTRQWKVKLDPV